MIKEEINDFLFKKDSNEINGVIFDSLSRLNADLSGINFDGKNIQGFNFSRLEGVVINLDKVPNKNLSRIKFKGVTLKGTLDDAIIEYTDFADYIGDIRMNPQTIINKSIKGSILSGLIINGNFDDIVITGVNFKGAKGDIRINPQKVPNKELIGIDFSNVLLCGYSDKNNNVPTEPSFNGCTIYDCKFKNAKGQIAINLDLLGISFFPKLSLCDLTGVIVKGKAKSNYEPIHCVNEDGTILFNNVNDDLYGSYYFDSQGNYIHIYLYQSMMWDDYKKSWKYIPRENEENLKIDVTFKENQKKEKQKLLYGFRKRG